MLLTAVKLIEPSFVSGCFVCGLVIYCVRAHLLLEAITGSLELGFTRFQPELFLRCLDIIL